MIAERILKTFRSPARELNRLMKAYVDQGKFTGAILIARGGRILLSEGYGMANLETQTPNTPTTPFRIGSMTKPFTAVAIMQLVESGRLSIDSPLEAFLPDFPNAARITIHHLLSNTSGIADYIVMPAYECLMQRPASLNEIISLFRDEPLKFEPGSDFGYSNSNWVLLGLILEQLHGKVYAEIIRERIFEPAGMKHSGYTWEHHPSVGYLSDNERAPIVHESTMHAAGGLYSTAEDLLRLDRALYDERLLRQETLARMFQPGYGYGWEVNRLYNRRAISHSGGIPGYVSNFVRLVDDDVTLILLSNLGSAAYSDITEKLAAAVLGEPYAMPSPRTFVEVNPAVFADYVGTYDLTYFGRTSELRFAVEGGRMVMHVHGLPKSAMHPMSDTKFFTRSKGEVELTFVRGSEGQVNTIDVLWDKHRLEAVRK